MERGLSVCMMRSIVCCIIKVLISIECCCRSRGMVKDVKPLLGRALLGTRQRLRYACWIHFHGTAISRDTSILIMKTRHCISGWGRVVPLGLWLCASWMAWPIVIVCGTQTAVGVTCRGVNALILLDWNLSFYSFFLWFSKFLYFCPQVSPKQRCVFIGNNIALVLYSECPWT